MATQLQLRKGTKIQNDAFTGAQGELTMCTDTKGLRIHDGATQGGFEVPVLVAVQRPTAANNYTWFRKWSDGWVEQGGLAVYDANPKTISFPITMADTNYTGLAIQQRNANLGAVWAQINTKSTTSFVVGGYFSDGQAGAADSNRRFNWQVSGMAA
jgi:hypothetical protein